MTPGPDSNVVVNTLDTLGNAGAIVLKNINVFGIVLQDAAPGYGNGRGCIIDDICDSGGSVRENRTCPVPAPPVEPMSDGQ